MTLLNSVIQEAIILVVQENVDSNSFLFDIRLLVSELQPITLVRGDVLSYCNSSIISKKFIVMNGHWCLSETNDWNVIQFNKSCSTFGTVPSSFNTDVSSIELELDDTDFLRFDYDAEHSEEDEKEERIKSIMESEEFEGISSEDIRKVLDEVDKEFDDIEDQEDQVVA